jgi:hypothetical protein
MSALMIIDPLTHTWHIAGHATREWQLKGRYCRETGAYLRITDRASLGRW